MTRLPSRLLSATLALVATSSTPTLAQDPPAKASVSRMNVGSVLGIEVRTSTERNVGRIIDLLAAPNGGVEAVVVEFGGFLGIGTRKIAVEWSALRLDKDGGSLVAMIEIPREQLRSAPDYKPDQPVVVRRMEATLPATAEPPYETEPPQPSKEKPISRRKQR